MFSHLSHFLMFNRGGIIANIIGILILSLVTSKRPVRLLLKCMISLIVFTFPVRIGRKYQIREIRHGKIRSGCQTIWHIHGNSYTSGISMVIYIHCQPARKHTKHHYQLKLVSVRFRRRAKFCNLWMYSGDNLKTDCRRTRRNQLLQIERYWSAPHLQ